MDQDVERSMWQFFSWMTWSIGEMLPGERSPMTLARAVELSRHHYGEMARPLLDLEITLH